MNKYEAMFIFQPQADQVANAKKIVEESLKEKGITIESNEDFGLRTLAYPIRKEREGHYWLYKLTMNPEKVASASTLFRHTPEILRSLVTKQSERKKREKSTENKNIRKKITEGENNEQNYG